MKNLMFNVTKFLKNKNTVTILGVFLGILVLYFGYQFRVNQAVKPQKVPYALTTIQPREKITEDMIGYASIPPSMIIGKTILSADFIIGKYANYNTLIPEGSLFYENAVISEMELPNASLINVPEGHVPFSMPVDINSTYGNSILPGDYINIYFKALDDQGKVMIGKFVDNVKVLAVKDGSGKPVFENTEEDRTPSSLLFAVPEELHLLLRKAYYLRNTQVAADVIPVPNTEAYAGPVGTVSISNQFLKLFIELKTADVPLDQLPDLESPTLDNNGDQTGQQ